MLLPRLSNSSSIAMRFLGRSAIRVKYPAHANIARNAIITRSLASNTTTESPPKAVKSSESPLKPPSDTKIHTSLSSSESSATSSILDEKTLISQLSPLKRILCLCPVPLGRKRIAWTGGDPCSQDPVNTSDAFSNSQNSHNLHNSRTMSTNNMNTNNMENVKIKKYRYGESYAIGVAVSDPYLTHALPITLSGPSGGFHAEMVPTFRCDSHNLGTSPVFHTNLPYFRHDLLQLVGHFDIGAVVIALPMKPSTNPFCPIPMSLQLEQTERLEDVRDGIAGVLQHYITGHEGEDDAEEEDEGNGLFDNNSIGGSFYYDGRENGKNVYSQRGNPNQKRRKTSALGPLNLQGYVHHRLSIVDVFSRSNECDTGRWDNIANALKRNQMTTTRQQQFSTPSYNGERNYVLGRQDFGYYNTYLSVAPEIHASVALNAMMEESGCRHNSFF